MSFRYRGRGEHSVNDLEKMIEDLHAAEQCQRTLAINRQIEIDSLREALSHAKTIFYGAIEMLADHFPAEKRKEIRAEFDKGIAAKLGPNHKSGEKK